MRTHPNWKVDPFSHHLNLVFIQAPVLPEKLSVDYQTIMFHGSSKLKSRIKNKKTGNAFQCNSICSDGYTATFFFVINNLLENILKKVFRLYTLVLCSYLISFKIYTTLCTRDNLLMSATFVRNAIRSKNKLKIH